MKLMKAVLQVVGAFVAIAFVMNFICDLSGPIDGYRDLRH